MDSCTANVHTCINIYAQTDRSSVTFSVVEKYRIIKKYIFNYYSLMLRHVSDPVDAVNNFPGAKQ